MSLKGAFENAFLFRPRYYKISSYTIIYLHFVKYFIICLSILLLFDTFANTINQTQKILSL